MLAAEGGEVGSIPLPVASPAFIRVLDPSDRWLQPTNYTVQERQGNFRGDPKHDISVAMEAKCPATKVLAALHGARRDKVLDRPAFYRFSRAEIEHVGGDLADTPSKPPWPKDYCDAHHDVVEARDEVAEHMAALYQTDRDRVAEVEAEAVLLLIAELLSQDDVDERFRKGATYRFRSMFMDGGAERALWVRVARSHHFLLEQATVSAELRKMYQDKNGRLQWEALMTELGVEEAGRRNFK